MRAFLHRIICKIGRHSGFSIFYRALWLLLGLAGFVWGVILGMTIAGAGIVGPATAAAGTVITIGLMVTLVLAGKEKNE